MENMKLIQQCGHLQASKNNDDLIVWRQLGELAMCVTHLKTNNLVSTLALARILGHDNLVFPLLATSLDQIVGMINSSEITMPTSATIPSWSRPGQARPG
jgi:hypothetical protein